MYLFKSSPLVILLASLCHQHILLLWWYHHDFLLRTWDISAPFSFVYVTCNLFLVAVVLLVHSDAVLSIRLQFDFCKILLWLLYSIASPWLVILVLPLFIGWLLHILCRDIFLVLPWWSWSEVVSMFGECPPCLICLGQFIISFWVHVYFCRFHLFYCVEVVHWYVSWFYSFQWTLHLQIVDPLVCNPESSIMIHVNNLLY